MGGQDATYAVPLSATESEAAGTGWHGLSRMGRRGHLVAIESMSAKRSSSSMRTTRAASLTFGP
jgi:hypothetical protein